MNQRLMADADTAYARAVVAAAPFTPSRAQVEAELAPVVRAMHDMSEPQCRAYVSGARAGTYAAVAIRM